MNGAVQYIQEKLNGFKPDTGIILGSGLGGFADGFESIKIPYSEIPGFEKSRVEGHKGQLVSASIEGRKVLMMQGRYHFYEGYSMQTAVYPVKVMKMLGIKTLIITNAAGAVNKSFKPADLMLITDHINFMGDNPLRGVNDDSLGVRFPDMSGIYSKELIEKALKAAKRLGIKIQQGVYAASIGPSYETPAEINMFRILGADAIGMSTVPEAVTAKWCGLNVLGISCITNYAAGVIDAPLSHAEVIENADIAAENFKNLLKEILKDLD